MRGRAISLSFLAVFVAGLAVAQVATFPSGLYTYVETTGVVSKAAFTRLAREVEAIEASLGVGLVNVPARDTRCFAVTNPISSELLTTLWRAPYGLVVDSLYCETVGGTSVTLDVRIDDGSPSAISGVDLTCDSDGDERVAGEFSGDTDAATGDRFDLAIGTVTGAVTQVSVCVGFVPGAQARRSG